MTEAIDERPNMPRRDLLLCFDAFGTLFRPRRPIAEQYSEVARACGLGGFTDEQVQSSFKTAFKAEAEQNPNYGKANGMDAEKWWTNIIHNTFKPLVSSEQQLPSDLAPRLLHRFWSMEGYEPLPGAVSLLQRLRSSPPAGIDRLVVGVVTNSDDRVPSVLRSIGFRVSDLRYGSASSAAQAAPDSQYDIDFTVMSYDVGHEKPDKRMFAAAEELVLSLPSVAETSASDWSRIFVGDEYDKDVIGAQSAGWGAVLLTDDLSEVPKDVAMAESGSKGIIRSLGSETDAVAVLSMEHLARQLGVRFEQDSR